MCFHSTEKRRRDADIVLLLLLLMYADHRNNLCADATCPAVDAVCLARSTPRSARRAAGLRAQAVSNYGGGKRQVLVRLLSPPACPCADCRGGNAPRIHPEELQWRREQYRESRVGLGRNHAGVVADHNKGYLKIVLVRLIVNFSGAVSVTFGSIVLGTMSSIVQVDFSSMLLICTPSSIVSFRGSSFVVLFPLARTSAQLFIRECREIRVFLFVAPFTRPRNSYNIFLSIAL